MKKLILLLICLLLAIPCQARTITVDDDGPAHFNTIQAAINDANDGDEIVVNPGIYTGDGNRDIDFLGSAITVRSIDPNEPNIVSATVIDCQRSGRGFYFHTEEDANSVLDGFTILNGNAYYGGAIYCYGSSPTIRNCRISRNEAVWGAGIFCKQRSCATISNCIIYGNTGHGISCSRSSDSTINNCLIIGNTAGGIFCYIYSSPIISNCTISENIGAWGGGILSQSYSNPIVSNCILWENRATYGNEIALLGATYPSTITVTYSDVQGGASEVYVCSGCTLNWGPGNVDANPMFMDANGLDEVLCTEDDNLRLFGGSPCIDAGDNSAVTPSLPTDIEGNPRIINGTVDMGAYEGAHQGFMLNTKSLKISEGEIATFTVALVMDPNRIVEVTVAHQSGDTDIFVDSGALLIFDSSNYAIPQSVTLMAAEDADNLNGTATVWISASGFVTNWISATEVDNDEPISNILFVDASSPGVNNGASWAQAYTELRDAMSIAATFPQVTEIRVAQGIYRPAGPNGSREATFQLINGVIIQGSYAGFGEPDPDVRDVDLYETILSGDLYGNDIEVNDPCDLLNEPTRAENSYHVVTGSGTDVNTILDGFTIIAGNANGRSYLEDPEDHGGGIYIYSGNPTVINCRFIGNSAERGGGMYNDERAGEGNLTIMNCKFIANSAHRGGGMYNYKSKSILTNCAIISNSAKSLGGGICNVYSSITLTNCIFSGNSASSGGGMCSSGGSPNVTNCIFTGNSAVYNGGGMANCVCSPIVSKCIFHGNSASITGGGIYNASSSPVLTNCTFSDNSAENGGGIHNCEDRGPGGGDPSNPTLTNCTFSGNSAENGGAMSTDYGSPMVTNSILWDGDNEIWNNDGSTIAITYSDIWGGYAGTGNIDADPCFADPNNDNYHLKSQAGRWDANEGRWAIDDVTSPCIDAGNPQNPIREESFPNGGIINMGAYGGTAEASKSYFGEPVCETIVAGDINGDCIVDWKDFAFMALHWLRDENP